MHTTLYRTWRPKSFDEVIGQQDIVRVLKNEIRLNKISHAYLFCGPRGTGKTSCARILARSVNCLEGPTEQPCGKCSSCISIDRGISLDVIEIDAASNRGVDNIRELREKVLLSPVKCKYKIYIIDEVHMLTGEAFNALLKTLEEPPKHTIFIMATTESHKLPKTIISRCQRFDFHRISSQDIATKLQKEAEAENINIDASALRKIAESSDGAMRDAESILDQLSVLSDQDNAINENDVLSLLGRSNSGTLYEILQNLLFNDYSSLITSFEQLTQSGTDILLFSQDLLSYCRDIIILAETNGKSKFLSIIPENENDIYLEQAKRIQIGYLIKLTVLLSNVLPNMKFLSRPQLLLETTLLQLRYLIDHPVSKRKKSGSIQTNLKKDGSLPQSDKYSKNTSASLKMTKSASSSKKTSIKNFLQKEKPPEIKDPLWKEFISKLKTISPDIFINIMRTQLVKVDNQIAYVVFTLENKFSYKQLNKSGKIKELNSIFHKLYPDISFNLSPSLGFNPDKVSSELKKRQEKEQIINEPAIIKVLKTFQTTIEKIEETSKEKL